MEKVSLLIGKPRNELTVRDIDLARASGLITKKEKEAILHEMNLARKIWQPLAPGVQTAASLW